MPGLGLLIFVLVEHAGPEAFPWTVRSDGPGVVNYESPTSRKPLLDWKAYRVVNKPIRPFGIMSSLVLARALGSYHARPAASASREGDPDPQELKKIEGGGADRLLRDQTQAKCVPIWIDRREVVSAQETLGDLGLELRRSAGAGDLPASRA